MAISSVVIPIDGSLERIRAAHREIDRIRVNEGPASLVNEMYVERAAKELGSNTGLSGSTANSVPNVLARTTREAVNRGMHDTAFDLENSGEPIKRATSAMNAFLDAADGSFPDKAALLTDLEEGTRRLGAIRESLDGAFQLERQADEFAKRTARTHEALGAALLGLAAVGAAATYLMNRE